MILAKRFTAVDLDEGCVENFLVFNDIDQRVKSTIEVSVDVSLDVSCQKQTQMCFRRFRDTMRTEPCFCQMLQTFEVG